MRAAWYGPDTRLLSEHRDEDGQTACARHGIQAGDEVGLVLPALPHVAEVLGCLPGDVAGGDDKPVVDLVHDAAEHHPVDEALPRALEVLAERLHLPGEDRVDLLIRLVLGP